MLNRATKLPPLDYFLAFEAAAQSGGFANAAQALNIAESAISRKIRLLEQHYDTPLFVRGPRSVELTATGRDLLIQVSRSLEILRDASDDVLSRSNTRSVNLAATNSVAALWLLPKLSQFNKSNSHVTIMLTASDNDQECLSQSMDLTILRGDGEWSGFDARLLFGETVFPVCSKDYLRRNPQAARLAALGTADLIEVDAQHDEWMTWANWMTASGGEKPSNVPAAFFNTYPLAVQAAVDGLGVTLGWGHLVDHLISKGELVRPLGDFAVRTKSGYYLLKRKGSNEFPQRKIVEDWLWKLSDARRRYAAEAKLVSE